MKLIEKAIFLQPDERAGFLLGAAAARGKQRGERRYVGERGRLLDAHAVVGEQRAADAADLFILQAAAAQKTDGDKENRGPARPEGDL